MAAEGGFYKFSGGKKLQSGRHLLFHRTARIVRTDQAIHQGLGVTGWLSTAVRMSAGSSARKCVSPVAGSKLRERRRMFLQIPRASRYHNPQTGGRH